MKSGEPCVTCGAPLAVDLDGVEFCGNPDCLSFNRERSCAAVVAILVSACFAALNCEGSAMNGARHEAEANPTHTPLDVPAHFEVIRAALAVAREIMPDAYQEGAS